MAVTPLLISGTSHPALAKEISDLAGIPLGKIDIHSFPDKEISIRILDSVQHRDVFVLQSLVFEPNTYCMELLLILDALKRSDAASVTVVMPYFGYARQDRIDQPGTPVSAKLIADLLTIAGADRIITMDLHSDQIAGFFDIPVEQLLSRNLLIPYCEEMHLMNMVVVTPDKGGIKIASDYAKRLNAPMALIDKERIDAFNVEMHYFVGDVNEKTVLMPDDMCSTAGTIVHAAEACKNLGAQHIIAVIGHGLFIGGALDNIEKSSIEKLITTNSVPIPERIRSHPKIRVVSIAPLFVNAIRELI